MAVLLLKTRSVFFNDRIINVVECSSPSTSACLMLAWIGASTVAMKRVPMFIPSAPSASAAASCLPSAQPPEATKGILSSRAALAKRIQFPTSISPGCPAQSNPSMLMQSTPIRSAALACRTCVHLWITMDPAALNCRTNGSSPLKWPAVSMHGIFSSSTTWANAG